MMNIYEKLQTVRVEFQNSNVKKSGHNKYAGYDYFELQDIVPVINRLMLKHKMTSAISYNSEAILTIFNVEKPEEKIMFDSPMATASLKGCHDVQNLGAVQTYLRRYLYLTAFDIVESDALDSTHQPNKTSTSTKPELKKPQPKNSDHKETVRKINEKMKLLKKTVGEEDFLFVLKRNKVKVEKGIPCFSSFQQAETVILDLESLVASQASGAV